MAKLLAARLADAAAVGRARVMPYQLLAALRAADDGVPEVVRQAMDAALELSLGAVPALTGQVVVCPDVSGSMTSPVTGWRGTATSKLRCIDVAALMAAAVLRKNPGAIVLPFEQKVVDVKVKGEDSVMRNAERLAAIGGGGTNCSAPLAWLAEAGAPVDLVILVSDNQSWMDARRGATQSLHEWERIKQASPQARLVCIDIQPYADSQVPEREDVLNVGGFSDAVFRTVAAFADGPLDPAHWVGEIEKVELDEGWPPSVQQACH